jgi:hypothetical protein
MSESKCDVTDCKPDWGNAFNIICNNIKLLEEKKEYEELCHVKNDFTWEKFNRYLELHKKFTKEQDNESRSK